MELNLHTDLALRSLVLLAVEHPHRVAAVDLAARHRVSYAHVQKVVQGMRRAGFVLTHRGHGGGVQLARAPEEIRLGEVVRAMEPHMDLVECFDPARATCVLTGACDLTGALRRARSAFLAELDAVTLADLVRSRQVLRERLGLP